MENMAPLPARNSLTGVKRPAPPSLGAPFEPDLGSSPPKQLHSPKKRQISRPSPSPDPAELRYPSPIPTSSVGLPSSPPHRNSPFHVRRPLQRTLSTVSERAPLGAVPEILVPDTGEAILMGRSSNTSDYQLTFNRLVSRTHIKVVYQISEDKPTILVECLGANGAKVHCDGQVFDLKQGDKFKTSTVDVDIMLDVMDSRVLVKWPHSARENSSATTAVFPGSWDEADSGIDALRRSSFDGKNISSEFSPPPSPSPMPKGNAPIVPSQRLDDEPVTVYEDEPEEHEMTNGVFDEEELDLPAPLPSKRDLKRENRRTKILNGDDAASSSELSELDLDSDEDENSLDAYTFSFGPGINSDLPAPVNVSRKPSGAKRGRPPRVASTSPPTEDFSISPRKANTLVHHISNQLAFARASSTSLSNLITNLPPSFAEDTTISRAGLLQLLASTPWIGEVRRQGKDAAGKPLESEFSYVAERDEDIERRNAVTEGLKKPGLRSCRKTHKQYFWRKPKMP